MGSFSNEQGDFLEDADRADRKTRRERMIAEAEERQRREDEFEAKRRAAATAKTLETNRRQILESYTARGVAPPATFGDGRPTISLDMLLTLGWTIETISGQPTLIEPRRARSKKKGSAES